MRESGAVSGGMIPKVAMALAALEALPRGLVKIAPAAGEDAVLAALSAETGTRFTRTETNR
jgi:acetylglutamate kinase